MFINNPDPYLLPSYRISPFRTNDISNNLLFERDNYASYYFDNRFGANNWNFIKNGREGINIVLKSYNLLPSDIVTILTTTQNFYISSCVTKQIEEICNWNREIVSGTKLLFVNHEFGYPYPEMEMLKKLNIPIIEDCCTTFFSQDDNLNVGKYGDFSIYSFPKFFPIQIGGLIVKNKEQDNLESSKIVNDEIIYIENVMSYYLKNENQLLKSRKEIYDYTVSKYSKYGFTERLATVQNFYPTSFLFNNNSIINDLPKLKIYLLNHGIQSSVFYGEDAFFIPCHQNLSHIDVDYILNCIISFKKMQ
ncbi:MAG: DegT/DnrJ/EryC1/StrS family aminotransferase [Bacteroidia bacterium]